MASALPVEAWRVSDAAYEQNSGVPVSRTRVESL
jgi:hypothetical protein